jgi:AraC-like DNA-binding protein
MRELRADHPVILEDEDTDGAIRPFLAWRVELVHLGRGPVRRSRVVIPLGGASVALVHVRRATILRGVSSDSDFSLFSTSPASPLVRVGSRPVGGGVCLMLGPQAPFEIYLPKDCCAFILSIPCASAADGDTPDALRALPANGRAELRALATEHSAVLSKCMDLIEAFRRSSAPDQVASQVQCRLKELLAPFAARLFSESRAAPAESTGKTVRCRAVMRACTFIDEHLREPITLDDLCKSAGVRARTLEYGFREFYDVGPMAYLRSVRLGRVRRDLLKARRPRACVASTARRWSFTHMSQFSRDYRLLFGESPSSTLARGRAPSKRLAVSG